MFTYNHESQLDWEKLEEIEGVSSTNGTVTKLHLVMRCEVTEERRDQRNNQTFWANPQ